MNTKNSKQAKAYEMYLSNAGMNTKEFVQLLIDQLGMTKLGARTYTYNCRKKSKSAEVVQTKEIPVEQMLADVGLPAKVKPKRIRNKKAPPKHIDQAA